MGRTASAWNAGDTLLTIKVDGSDLRQIATNGLNAADPRYSPDGKQIVFWNAAGLYVVAADGSEAPKPVGTVKGRHASFSPDGRLLLYEVGRYAKDVTIATARIDGSDVKQFVGFNDIYANSFGTLSRPAFTPDGKRILFLCRLAKNASSSQGKCEIWEFTIDKPRSRRVATDALLLVLWRIRSRTIERNNAERKTGTRNGRAQ